MNQFIPERGIHRKNLLAYANRGSLLAKALKLPTFDLHSFSTSPGYLSVEFQRCPPATGSTCFTQYRQEETVQFQGSSSSIKEMMKELLDAGSTETQGGASPDRLDLCDQAVLKTQERGGTSG